MVKSKLAFSLVELSIVLVILGLLTGGILAGQSLIRAAEFRAALSEHARYSAAIYTFRDKYFGIPGDIRNATAFWGRQSTDALCYNLTGAVGTNPNGACDANGDGTLGFNQAGRAGESQQFWRQLALAGLIEGTYSGLAGPNWPSECRIDIECPRSRLPNAGWGASHIAKGFGGDAEWFGNIEYGNYMALGAPHAAAYTIPMAPVLKPEEAWNFDVKVDDGRPTTGKLIARYWNNACTAPDSGAASATNHNASYRLSDQSIRCAIVFINTI
ncbi:MAG: hypothetical protein DI582_07595 [Azospirillum brasilense]|nr:MAG: hypothetical protein DI582_07595 [Azospirillum brasilense]